MMIRMLALGNVRSGGGVLRTMSSNIKANERQVKKTVAATERKADSYMKAGHSR